MVTIRIDDLISLRISFALLYDPAAHLLRSAGLQSNQSFSIIDEEDGVFFFFRFIFFLPAADFVQIYSEWYQRWIIGKKIIKLLPTMQSNCRFIVERPIMRIILHFTRGNLLSGRNFSKKYIGDDNWFHLEDGDVWHSRQGAVGGVARVEETVEGVEVVVVRVVVDGVVVVVMGAIVVVGVGWNPALSRSQAKWLASLT